MAFSLLSKSLLSKMSVSMSASPELPGGGGAGDTNTVADVQESGFSHLMNKDLYPVREKVVDENCPCDAEPFRPLAGESIEFMGPVRDDYIIAISNYRLFATEEEGFYSVPLGLIEAVELFGTKDKLLILCRDTRTFKLFFSSQFKCKLWQDRISDCLRRLSKEPKTTFAFVHRAYNKDKKMAKQDLLRLGLEEAGGVVQWAEEEGLEEEVDDGETDTLLSLKAHSEAWRDEVVTMEYERTGMGTRPSHKTGTTTQHQWRITQCNDKYKLCSTYPKLLVVPNSISEEELHAAAKFRMSGRIPAVVWRHQMNGCVIARSSQPLVGVLGWRSPEDEKLLYAISESCASAVKKKRDKTNNDYHLRPVTTFPQMQASSSAPQLLGGDRVGDVLTNGNGVVANGYLKGHYSDSDDDDCDDDDDEQEFTHDSVVPRLKVFDLRSYTAALGNRAKGGGCECTDYYPNCEVQYKCLPNIHAVRKSFLQLRAVLMSDDQLNFLSGLESTQWLHYLCQLLSVACEVVGVVNDQAQPILIHCSDGWDRTTQVVALAELMLDPFYRTIKGFKVLIEREWLAFGHKFGERCGLTTDDANQQSPVFLQWLDCVHQLTRQYPCDFQFNDNFLLKLGSHVYSCLYGTFLYNNMKEREQSRVNEDTTSVWALLHENNQDIINYLYSSDIIDENKVLRPVPHIRSMLLWREMYTTSLLIPYQTQSLCSESLSPRQTVSGPTSLSSTPSPSHHATLTQTPCPISNGNDKNLEFECAHATIEKAVEKSGKQMAAAEDVTGSDDLGTSEVKDQHSEAIEVKGEDDGISVVNVDVDNGNTAIDDSQRDSSFRVGDDASVAKESQESAAIGAACDMPNGHLLTMEHPTGLMSSSCSERVLANALTKQQPPSVIEMRDLTHLEEVRRNNDKNLPLSTSIPPMDPSPLPLPAAVNGENKTTPISSPSSRSNSEPVIQDRTRNGLISVDNGNSVRQSSTLYDGGTTNCSNRSTPEKEKETQFDSAMTSSIENSKAGNRLALGVDGLPCSLDPLQKRVRELELKHRREVDELRLTLKEVQIQAAEAVRLQKQQHQQEVRERLLLDQESGVLEGEKMCSDGSRHSLHSDDNMPSPSSLHSWDCVNQEDEHGVRWIPDHAATHCQLCGAAFWTARRKHHCRSCGGVFCGTCSNFYCPVPHEQLFVDVRVCEKCYYRLDGHLKNGITSSAATPS